MDMLSNTHTSRHGVGSSMVRGDEEAGRVVFVAMKSSNRVLKWIQAVCESPSSTEECKSMLAAGAQPKGTWS